MTQLNVWMDLIRILPPDFLSLKTAPLLELGNNALHRTLSNTDSQGNFA